MDGLGVDRRRLGTGLLAFGLVGVVLAGIVAIGLVGTAIAARDLDNRLVADQARLVETIDEVSATMDRLATATANGGQTLATTSQTLGSVSDVLTQVADLSTELSTSLDVSILGQRPLAGAAERFGRLAEQVLVFRDDADRLATNLSTNAVDVTALAAQISRLKARLDTLSSRIEGFDRTSQLVGLVVGGIVLFGLVVAWIAAAAGICAWIGWRLRRSVADTGSRPDDGDPGPSRPHDATPGRANAGDQPLA